MYSLSLKLENCVYDINIPVVSSGDGYFLFLALFLALLLLPFPFFLIVPIKCVLESNLSLTTSVLDVVSCQQAQI